MSRVPPATNRNWTRPRVFRPDTTKGYRHERVGSDDCPYLERWMIQTGPFAIRLHHFLRSDEPDLHDHPWWFITLVLRGSYEDWVECPACKGVGAHTYGWNGQLIAVRCQSCEGGRQVLGTRMRPGTIRFRPASHRHRVVTDGVWTLVLSGRKSRDWGFWVNGKFLRQRAYFRKHGGHAACEDP